MILTLIIEQFTLQNQQYLESPIESLTADSLMMEPMEISQLPWYFKGKHL